MRGSLPLLALTALALAACDKPGSAGETVREFDGTGAEVTPERRVTVHEGTAVIDQAKVLSAADKASLARRIVEIAEATGRKLTIVLLRPAEGQSMEQVTWAIAPKAGTEGPMMLVVDVGSGSVRVDNLSDPAQSAAIARAISPEVKAGRVASGVARGLDQVMALGRSAA
ncbi:TPM domain-containing protein [Sphingomonas glaciei]|uniref:TPM domain-containing protein n=1 Tax=Sphingomonas glaciei TaxID=2938948 RepID=A0ABY5MYW2_9SPHN|nr:TPM domain-containing protein [Sphingomonas glaciei]UUR09209.1 TPM domain-containing protein [Sphingomonas glaciei]